MYEFRPFLNTDPPYLAAIWRSQPSQRRVVQPMTPALLEQAVFGKQIFDREGLIVATHEGRPVGFAHATFGPNEQQTGLSTDIGTTQLLMIDPNERQTMLANDLLAHSEAYLRSRGAKVLYAGGIYPLDGFYLGLYGGSELPGILASDPFGQLVRTSGYREIDRVIIFQRALAGFQGPVSRQLRTVRRDFTFSELYAPPPANWWEACTLGNQESIRFSLTPRRQKKAAAWVRFWDMEPLASSWGQSASGIAVLYVAPDYRRQALATFLLSESLKKLMARGVTIIEAQTMHHNHPAISLYGKLGFTEVDCGYVFRKESA